MAGRDSAPGGLLLDELLDQARRRADRGLAPPLRQVTSPVDVAGALRALHRRACREVRSFEYPELEGLSPSPWYLNACRQLDEQVLRRGVPALRVIDSRPLRERAVRQAVLALEARGARTRLVQGLPFADLAVFDHLTAVIPLDYERQRAGIFVVEDPFTVSAIACLHEFVWRLGTPILRVEPAALPNHLQPVLEELVAGVKDEIACRHLGLSARTYSRRVAELLQQLGVESRFQAGLEAARRGLIRAGPRGEIRVVPAPQAARS